MATEGNSVVHHEKRRWSGLLLSLPPCISKSAYIHLPASIILLIITLLTYQSVLSHDFILNWDDEDYVLLNNAVRGITPEHLKEAFSSNYVGNFAPVQIVSYMLDYQLWGLDPADFHRSNIIIHAINGILFYLLLIRCRLTPVAAFAAAFIFLVHPVQVETVAWISQRKNVLAMQFFLCALHAYVTCRDKGDYQRAWYYFSMVFFLLSLLSKSVTVVFPAVLLLYDYCFHDKPFKKFFLLNKIPFALLSGATVIITMVFHLAEMDGALIDHPGLTHLSTTYTMLPVIVSYVQDCLAPLSLSPFYAVDIKTSLDREVVISAAALLLLCATGWRLYRTNRRSFFWYVLFFVCLLPVSQVIPLVTLKNDRYLYFPMLGFAAFAGGGIFTAVQSLNNIACRHAALSVLTILLLGMPVFTREQAEIWKDDLTLWGHAIQHDPDNQVGWIMLLKGHTRRGNSKEAIEAFNHLQKLRLRDGSQRGWEKFE